MKKLLASLLLSATTLGAAAQLKPIDLPAPDTTGGKPFMQTLSERKSTREFSPELLSDSLLSNLLWAANGVNRPDGHRTAPSAMDRREINIYVFTPEGVYFYDAPARRLNPIADGDRRQLLEGGQKFASTAPVSLLLVADGEKFADRQGEMTKLMMAADAGIVCQNINLFCSSAGLVTVPRASMDRDAIAALLGLPASQLIMLNNPVGKPKE